LGLPLWYFITNVVRTLCLRLRADFRLRLGLGLKLIQSLGLNLRRQGGRQVRSLKLTVLWLGLRLPPTRRLQQD
jgi:hypothetical protein